MNESSESIRPEIIRVELGKTFKPFGPDNPNPLVRLPVHSTIILDFEEIPLSFLISIDERDDLRKRLGLRPGGMMFTASADHGKLKQSGIISVKKASNLQGGKAWTTEKEEITDAHMEKIKNLELNITHPSTDKRFIATPYLPTLQVDSHACLDFVLFNETTEEGEKKRPISIDNTPQTLARMKELALSFSLRRPEITLSPDFLSFLDNL